MIFSLLRFKISKLNLYNIGKIKYLKKLFKFFILFICILPVTGPKIVFGGQSKKIGVFHSGK